MQQAPAVERLSFRRAPLAAAALWFAAGIVLARWQQTRFVFHPVLHLLGAFALLGALSAVALRRGLTMAWLGVAAMWMTLGVAALEWHPSAPLPAGLIAYADNLSRTVEGHVVRVRTATRTEAADGDDVPSWERSEEAPRGASAPLSVDLDVDAIEDVTPDRSTMVRATGGVRIAVYEAGGLALRCGDRVIVPLRLKTPQRFRDPGAFQVGDYLLAQGIAVEANVQAGRLVVESGETQTMRCRVFAAQSWAASRIVAFTQSPANRLLPPLLRLGEQDAAMLNAMLFGDRSGLTHGLRVGFERTGSFHLFVVSGLHVGLLAAGVFWLLSRLRVPAGMATICTIALTAAYTVLTGFGQPAQRALAMTCVYLGARILSRNGNSLNALGAAVLGLLVWSPASLFEASFQMTALAIVAIGGIAIPLAGYTSLRYAGVPRDVFHHPRTQFEPRAMQLRMMLELWGEATAALLGRGTRRVPAQIVRALLWAGELALIGAVAELVMVLPMALYFHRAAVFALPANLIVIPVIALLAPAAVATFLGSLVSPWAAFAPAAATAALLHAITWAIARISRLAVADVRVPPPAMAVAAAAILLWLTCCWLVRRGAWGAAATALLLPVIASAVLWPEPVIRTPGTLELSALDVGQGDSLLAVNPEGAAMLIDAGGPVGRGGPAEIASQFDIGEEVVSPYLWARRMRRLDVVVLSHAHSDHMGGMPAVLENFRPRELWLSGHPQSEAFQRLLAEAARLGIVVRTLRAGDRQVWGSVAISVLGPAVRYSNAEAPRNDDSLVLRMDFGKASVLLEGDAETPSEQAMLAAGVIHPVTLLKVAHHGSRTSTTQAFVDAAAPHDAVISVGRHNTFGHPRAEVIARLAMEHAHVFRTDEAGLTRFVLRADGSIHEEVDGVPLRAH